MMDTNLLRSAEILKQTHNVTRAFLTGTTAFNAIRIRYDAHLDTRAIAGAAATIAFFDNAAVTELRATKNAVADVTFGRAGTGTIVCTLLTLKEIVDEINETGNGWTAELMDLPGGMNANFMGEIPAATCFGVWGATNIQLAQGMVAAAPWVSNHLGVRIPAVDGEQAKLLIFDQRTLAPTGAGSGFIQVVAGDTAADLAAPIWGPVLLPVVGATAAIPLNMNGLVGKDLYVHVYDTTAFTVGMFDLTFETQRKALRTSEAFMSGQNPESIGF